MVKIKENGQKRKLDDSKEVASEKKAKKSVLNQQQQNNESHEVPAKKVKTMNNNNDGNTEKRKFEKRNGEKPSFKKQTFSSKKPAFEKGKFVKKYSNNGKEADKQTDKKEINKKELRTERKKKKLGGSYDMSVDMKKIWEILRREDTTAEVRQKLCKTLHDRIKGHVKQASLAHDTTRVLECLVQYGNESQRETVFEEIKSEIDEISKSKYGRFLVLKLLKYGDKKQISFIIQQFTGKVVKLIKHSFACQIIESIFNEHANEVQRFQMLTEFYDPTSSILQNIKAKSLSDVLNDQPQAKDKILNNLKEILVKCIDKTILMFSIIHRVFLEYFLNCNQNMKSEMIDSLGEHLVHMIHTKDGCLVAMNCIWYSTAKQRKTLIKSLKSFVHKVACDEHGHRILLAIFDSVDDTKFVSKLILDELFRTMDDLFKNDYGRKVLYYILAPRDKRFFIPDYIKLLELGDNTTTSKKDRLTRYKEVADYSIKFYLEYFNKNIGEVIYNGAYSYILPAIMNYECDTNEICTKLADAVFESEYKEVEGGGDGEAKKCHIIEDPTVHFVFKQILKDERNKKVVCSKKLSDAFLEHENVSYMKSWSRCNRGCFLLVMLIEACEGDKEKEAKIKNLLKSDDTLMKTLKKSNLAGAKILQKNLAK